MKKLYEKPMMAVEYYELTQAIASCGVNVGSVNELCVVASSNVPDGYKNFASAFGMFVTGYCRDDDWDVPENDGVCYHTATSMMFTS